jgi:hypothetical protein
MGAVQIGVCEANRGRACASFVPAVTEIVIDVDDVHAIRDRIVEQGIEPTEDLQKRDWGLTDFRITDPDGYYLRSQQMFGIPRSQLPGELNNASTDSAETALENR